MNIKEEISKIDENQLEKLAELSAIIRNSATIKNKLEITVENNSVARKIFKLFKDIYDINASITVRRRSGLNKNLIYILSINHNYINILKDLSIWDKDNNFLEYPNDYLVSDNENIRAYLRGLFMTCGSINDPKISRYHLEFLVDTKKYAIFIQKLLNSFELNSKIIKREKNYMIYIKEAEKISDYLRLIKSYNGVMYFEDIRIYRDHKNITNRLNNCEQANMDKIFLTASKQIEEINILKSNDMIDTLDQKLQEIINYRLKYPEYSLNELAIIMSKELGYTITKSGLNHRFRKIKEIVRNLK